MDKKLGRQAILVVTAILALGSAGAWGQGGGRGGPRDQEMMMQRRERLREFRDDMRRQELERQQRRRADVMPSDVRPEPAQALQPGGWRDGNGAGPRGPGGQFQNGARREQLRHLSPEERQQLREQMRDAAREVYGQ